VLHAARWKYLQDAKYRHFGAIAQICVQLRHVSTIGKNLLNRSRPTSSTCPDTDNMVNFGLLTAEICWRVWGTPANFNGFRVLAASLHGTLCASPKLCGVEQTAPPISAGRPSRWALAHILVLCVCVSEALTSEEGGGVGKHYAIIIITIILKMYLAFALLWADHYIFALWFLLSFLLFFPSPNLSRCRLDVCHTSTRTWCGLSANLGCRSETCCTRLAESTGRKKVAKNRHLGTIAQLCPAISSQ